MTNCFCDAKMATQKSGMEFSKKGGDEFVVGGKPQLAVVEYKATLLGSHLGVAKTIRHLQDNFYWTNMRRDVHVFVS